MSILDYETVALNESRDAMRIIDQTLLPGRTEIIELKTAQEIWDAIYLLRVRGAPAIGVAAGYGIYLLAKQIAKEHADPDDFYAEYSKQSDYLNSARPTAVNLSWALKRMDGVCREAIEHVKASPVNDALLYIIGRLYDEAVAIQQEDIASPCNGDICCSDTRLHPVIKIVKVIPIIHNLFRILHLHCPNCYTASAV